MKKKYSKTEESGCHSKVVGQGFPALHHKAFYLAHFVRLASNSCLKLVEGDGVL